MSRSLRVLASSLAALILLGVVAAYGVTRANAGTSSSPSQAMNRQPGSWTGADRDRLAQLRDSSVAGEHEFDRALGNAFGPASAYQEALLKDGSISFANYTAAANSWVACVRAAGISVPDIRPNGLGRYNDIAVRVTNPVGGDARAAISSCSTEYTTKVDFIWASVTAALTKEVFTASRPATAACFAAAGYGPMNRPWESPEPAVREAFGKCAQEVGAELDISESFGMDGDGLATR